MLVSHSAFKPLKISYINAISKGLKETVGDKQSFTEYEKYSFDVMSRAVEIDSVLDGLKIGIHYLEHADLELISFSFSKVFVYHVENIVSRLTTVEERIKLLIATSLLKGNIKIASNKGKSQFESLVNDFPLIKHKLMLLSKVVSKYKVLRNKIAHESSYSSRDTIIASTLEDTEIELPINHSEMKHHILSSATPEFSSLILEIDESVNSVISALGEIYIDLIK
ncbi:hypothetical protein [Shewanella scandinavica]|uniref:Cthe-2314-like HEPN domain-containing protein n=1 Tax=Shewanella scandinavica TaxID=3063538 RepID=A0ABU3G245_9GAMM|nr:hypothetical protein [Shewanella sp. SP2S1-2]MDT3281709.1 hypothetical protein [Shewanella sp. SP2S1-2]